MFTRAPQDLLKYPWLEITGVNSKISHAVYLQTHKVTHRIQQSLSV